MDENSLTQQQLQSLLYYSVVSGRFYWHCGGKGRRRDGRAGKVRRDGYVLVCIRGKDYLAHRLAFFYLNGVWPVSEVDHINRNPSCNGFHNLRESTHENNLNNVGVRVDNTSGIRGVSWDSVRKCWRATYRNVFLGRYASKEEAEQAVVKYRQPLVVPVL